MMRLLASLWLMISVVATQAEARTWFVEKDGSGDFTVIQEAVDAAADGDTIRIGAGRFEEYSFAYHTDFYDVYAFVKVTKDELCFIGAGPEETLIGFEDFDPQYEHHLTVFNNLEDRQCTISSLSLSGSHEGLHWEGGGIEVSSCHFYEVNSNALAAPGRIHDCDFVNGDNTSLVLFGASNTRVERCHFENFGKCINVLGADSVAVVFCSFEDSAVGIQAENGGVVTLTGCIAAGISNAAINSIGNSGGRFSFNECDMTSNGYVIKHDGEGECIGRNSTLRGNGPSSVVINCSGYHEAVLLDLHYCNILNGGNLSVHARQNSAGLEEPIHLDLTNNYWGTLDPAQIDEWIDDYHDHDPLEGSHWVIVDYVPMMEDTVGVQQKSLSGVKDLFR